MSNTVLLDREQTVTQFAKVEPLIAAQKFITFQNGGSCSTSVPSLKVEEALAWFAQMFSEVDDGCGEHRTAQNEDELYDEPAEESNDDGDVFG